MSYKFLLTSHRGRNVYYVSYNDIEQCRTDSVFRVFYKFLLTSHKGRNVYHVSYNDIEQCRTGTVFHVSYTDF